MLTNSNFYIGDSSVSRLYQGENLVWDASHPDILCEWISNGDASTNPDVYFNTFMNPDLTLKVETKYSYHNRNYTGGSALFGSRASATDSRYYLFTFAGLKIDGQNLYTAKFWFKNLEGYSAVVPTLDEPHVITTCATYSSASAATAVNCILDGSTTSRAVTINQALSNTHQMYMFAMNNQGTAEYRCLADTRIYYMKIWRGNNLSRFFIPVLHWLNGQYVPCFYDKVNDTYTYNLGTDTPTYKISGDYLLDYIANGPDDNSGTKSVYYDTGVIPDSSIKVEISCSSYTIDKSVNLPIISGADANWRGFGIFLPMNYGNVSSRLGGSYVDGPQIVSNTKYIITTYQSTSTQGDMIVNGTAYSHATTDVYGTTSAYLFAYNVNGTVNISASHTGMKIYYTNFASGNIPTKTYIPVLHNNQASFLDLNSGTYIYNIGTATPSYQFKR